MSNVVWAVLAVGVQAFFSVRAYPFKGALVNQLVVIPVFTFLLCFVRSPVTLIAGGIIAALQGAAIVGYLSADTPPVSATDIAKMAGIVVLNLLLCLPVARVRRRRVTSMKKDFFISFNRADRDWATWIAWILEDAGYMVEFQDWDFRPGENFVLKMHEAIQNTDRTLLILSENFLNSSFTAAEWSSVFALDPATQQKKLVPVKVRPCKPDGLLGPIVYVDLTNVSGEEAKAALLGSFSERAKPARAPKFPGPRTTPKATFPGQSVVGRAKNRVEGAQQKLRETQPSPADRKSTLEARLDLNQSLNALIPSDFNMLLFAIDPPPGVIAPMPAPQTDRATQLLQWAQSPSGCGLDGLRDALSQITAAR